jgi:hypothetical protein
MVICYRQVSMVEPARADQNNPRERSKAMRARLIKTDGTTEPVELPGDDNLSAMYAAIGCRMVDVVRVLDARPGRPGIDMWIADDESVCKAEPNRVASFLCGSIADEHMATWLLGNVLVTGGADSEGDTLPLTVAQDRAIEHLAGSWRRKVEAINRAERLAAEARGTSFASLDEARA